MAGSERPPGPRRAFAAAALAATLVLPWCAGAVDLFSPGPLARGHEQLEGLTRCTECHQAGEKLSAAKCIACHGELKDRLARGRGFHGRIAPAERACETCHHEHQGRDFPLVDWGQAGRDRFDHAKTGWPLRGKHLVTPCAKCHEPRLVDDRAVKELLAKRPNRATWLGAALTCRACHFDDHRGQVSTDCERCHGEKSWKATTRGFQHARTRYPLRGKHAKVACAKCHPRKTDEDTAPGAFPAPVSPAFLILKPIPFARCLDCHKDPHKERFGDSCESCHTLDSWKEMVGRGKESVFHLKTRYPLEGAHVAVVCKACHGPFGREKPRYRNMAFQACTDCHFDAHVGQLARSGRPAPGCDACHDVRGWFPVRYDLEEHGKTPYPLAGAHVSVPCALCHPREERIAERVPARIREALGRQERPVQVSAAVLARPGFDRCETCHRDPHAGQLKPRRQPATCVACHMLGSWSVLTFDHQRDSRYPLTGKHATAACAACHPRVEGVTRYRPVETACAACHADAHGGQLARGRSPAAADCARCHDAATWKAPLFVHAPPFTPYRLLGKHAKAKCEACHKPVVLAAGVKAARYRPLPSACEGCHSDFHRGAFRGYVP